jgi:hypothetical protein
MVPQGLCISEMTRDRMKEDDKRRLRDPVAEEEARR